MYHKFNKDDKPVRKALYEAFNRCCAYCGNMIIPKNMHVDHILASNHKPSDNDAFSHYLTELKEKNFEYDSLENYVPTCSGCNIKKNNGNFNEVGTFRFFHDLAAKKVPKELKIIEKFKSNDDFPDYFPDFTGWRLLDFNNKHADLSYALNGYHLCEQDVDVCPKFPQLDLILKRLDQVNYCYVYGLTGCGKSLTLYQAASAYSGKGYLIYLLESDLDNNSLLPFLEDKKVLLIIDDAQKYTTQFLENKIHQCPPQVKILIGLTKNDLLLEDGVLIPEKDNIKTIYDFYAERMRNVQEIVEKIDSNVGPRQFQTSIKDRLDNALRKASNPWTFNYILRGEWNGVSAKYADFIKVDSIKELLGIIAFLQIYKLDSFVSKEEIDDILFVFNSKSSQEGDIEWLIKNKFILFNNGLRTIHLESAKKIFNCFIEWQIKEKKDVDLSRLANVFKYLLERDSFGKSFLWIYELGNHYLEPLWNLISNIIFKKEYFATIKDKNLAFYFLSNILVRNNKNNCLQYFLDNSNHLIELIEKADNSNLYGCASMANNLFNHDRYCNEDNYNIFISRLNIKKVIKKLDVFDIDSSLCAFGYLLNRLSIVHSMINGNDLEMLFNDSLGKLSEKVNVYNYDFYLFFMSQIYHLSPAIVNSFLLKTMDVLIEYSKRKPRIAFELFCFSDLGRITGTFSFEKYNPTIEQATFCKTFLKRFDYSLLEPTYKKSRVEDSQLMYEFLVSLSYYKKSKRFMKLAQLVDIPTNSYEDKLWVKENTELKYLFSIMYYGNKQKALDLIERKKNDIQVFSLAIAQYFPAVCVTLSKKGTKILIFENGWYEKSNSVIKEIVKIDKSQTRTIVEDNFDILREDYVMMKDGRYCSGDDEHIREFKTLCRTIKNHFPDIFAVLEKAAKTASTKRGR